VLRKGSLALALLLGGRALVHAEEPGGPASAAELVDEGKRLGKAGQLEPALSKFKQASGLSPSAEHDCLVSLAYRRLDRWAQAQLWLDRARARGEETPPRWCTDGLRREIEAQVRNGAFAPVDVGVTPAGATVAISAFAPDETFTAPRTVWVPLGVHELGATLAGHRPERLSLKLQTTNPYPVRIVLEREPGAPAPAAPIVAAPAAREPAAAVREVERAGGHRPGGAGLGPAPP
jgi:hypothetical protein